MVSTGRSEQTTPSEFVERLRDLIVRNVPDNQQLLVRLGEFAREAGRAISARRDGERPDAEALLSRWLDFNLESYSVASTHSLALLNGLLSAAQSTLIPNAAPAPKARAATASRVELVLSGRHGERAATGFVIENHFDRPLEVRFESAAFVPMTSGPELPASLVSFEPATLVIAPRGQAVVQVGVLITTDFLVGQTYTTTIRPLGFEAKQLGLSLTILAHANAASSSGPFSEPPISTGEGGGPG